MLRTVYAGEEKFTYLLVARSGVRQLSLKALPEHRIRLDAPAGIPLKEADAYVLRNIGRVRSEWQRIAAARRSIADGSRFPIAGTEYVIRRVAGTPSQVTAENGILTILAPTDDAARSCLKAYLSHAALERIRAQLEAYCPDEKPYRRVTVREQRSRWGSLSRTGNLSFNWKLILAPDEALCYVVAHELAHFTEFNHSPAFYRALAGIMLDYAPWMEWLKKNGSTLDF